MGAFWWYLSTSDFLEMTCAQVTRRFIKLDKALTNGIKQQLMNSLKYRTLTYQNEHSLDSKKYKRLQIRLGNPSEAALRHKEPRSVRRPYCAQPASAERNGSYNISGLLEPRRLLPLTIVGPTKYAMLILTDTTTGILC